MGNPKISIIVPVYNVEKYLPCCMDSLLKQTLVNIEIILVDDGSPDNCSAICDEYVRQDHRVKVIHKKNEGLGFARNSGLEIATGEYIAFVDSDDYMELNAYEKLYNIATNNKADVIYYNFKRFNDQGDTWTASTICEKIHYRTEEDVRGFMLDMIATGPKTKLDLVIQCSSCSAFYCHYNIKRHGIRFKSERELISEDLVFNIDFLLQSTIVMTIPDVFYNYRVNTSSLSRTIRSDRIDRGYFFYQYLLKVLAENNFEFESFLRATRWFIGYSRSSIRHYLQSTKTNKEKIQWLKEVVKHPYWQEMASMYPYWSLPSMKAFHFFLLHKKYYHILYFLEIMHHNIKR